MDIVSALEKFHKTHDLTGNQVATKLGISRQLYGKYRKGERTPKLDFYIKFKQVFNVDLMPEANNTGDVIKLLHDLNKRMANLEKMIKKLQD